MGASTSGGPPIVVPATAAAAQEAASEIAIATYRNPSVPLKPELIPHIYDGNDLAAQWLAGLMISIAGNGVAAYGRMSTFTNDGGQADQAPGTHLVALSHLAAWHFFVTTTRIVMYWLIYVKLRHKWPDKPWAEVAARDIAFSITALLAFFAGFWAAEVAASFDRWMRSADFADLDGRRRKLQSLRYTKSKSGDYRRDLMMLVEGLEVKVVGGVAVEVIVPSFYGRPKTKIILPKSNPSHDNNISLDVYEWRYDSSLKKHDWALGTPIAYNPSAMRELPAKIVADGAYVWMLSGNSPGGYKIFKQLQWSSPTNHAHHMMKWIRVPGEAIDLYPGKENLWAINKNQEIFTCPQKCFGGNWLKVPGKGQAIAVGPMFDTSTKSTKGMPTYVWIKDGNGKIWARREYDATDDVFPWKDMSGSPNVPRRVVNLLNERDPLSDALHPGTYKYPFLPFPPYSR